MPARGRHTLSARLQNDRRLRELGRAMTALRRFRASALDGERQDERDHRELMSRRWPATP
jgi:hypothetical protein